MERIHQLILKLKEQYEQQASPAQLLSTAQLLHQELAATQATPRSLGTSKVAVMMPSNMSYETYQQYAPKVVAEVVLETTAQRTEAKDEILIRNVQPPQVTETLLVDEGNLSIVQENGQLDMIFDPSLEIPTLTQHLHGTPKGSESINDKLKQGKTELVEFLKDTPVKDLRKAIGINDRFSFMNELFRGDEAMYERSIKTINGFNIYPEAEYWIIRELKTKLGWNPESEVVAQFDQLVKRRFS